MTTVLYLKQSADGTYVLPIGGTIVDVQEYVSTDVNTGNTSNTGNTLRVTIDETKRSEARDNFKTPPQTSADVLLPQIKRQMEQGLLQQDKSS